MLDMTGSMVDMLEWFDGQTCSCATVGRIAAETGYSRQTVRSNLKSLMAANCAERMHEPTGEYRLIEDPRDES